MKSFSDYSTLYEMVVGLEVHVELKTKTKIFCACPTDFGAEPNTQCCPICTGAPGTLPSLNRRAVELAIKAGIVTHCDISPLSSFDRKNYFYPDLPKAYQISQLDLPICQNGYLEIETKGDKKRIGITRIHLEEDAGKLIHTKDAKTLIDHNRCGVPLIEIVSQPDIRSPEEAKLYLKKLRLYMLYADISDCKMNEGSLRCDVNISVKKKGVKELGTRCEIKNINSFSFVEKAIEYEFLRQCNILESGDTVLQETRRFDEKSETTVSMRAKENGKDYRYFPEPDLTWIEITKKDIEKISAEIPKLPDERINKYRKNHGLDLKDCEILTSDKNLSDFFEATIQFTPHAKVLSNLLISELPRLYKDDILSHPDAQNFAKIATLYGERKINSSTAKKLLSRIIEYDEDPEDIVLREGLYQITDKETLREYLRNVIAENPKSITDYKSGKSFAMKFIIGKAMALSHGKADPELLQEIAKEMLS